MKLEKDQIYVTKDNEFLVFTGMTDGVYHFDILDSAQEYSGVHKSMSILNFAKWAGDVGLKKSASLKPPVKK